MNVKAFGNRVLVKKPEETIHYVRPSMDSLEWAYVHNVGNGVPAIPKAFKPSDSILDSEPDGNLYIKIDIEAGDKVWFMPQAALPVTLDGEVYHLVMVDHIALHESMSYE